MPRLARHIVQMPRSGVRELMETALNMSDVIHMEVGEPSFDTPAHIVEAAAKAAREGHTRYTSNYGILSLRERLVRKLERVNGIKVTPANIVVTAGAVCALSTTLMAMMDPGDEILTPDPAWPDYELMILLNHGIPVRYLMDPAHGFLPDLDQVESLITPRTKAILLNSPSNPTGAVFPGELVEGFVELARKHDLFLITDEIYEEIVFDGEQVSAMPMDTDDRVVGIFGFSKAYAMTGWRLGYLVAPTKIAAVVAALQEPITSCASTISQKAAEAALDGPQQCVAEMTATYKRRRDMAMALLQERGIPFSRPSGAFYMMVDVSVSGMDSTNLCKAFLKECHVAVAPGETFGPSARNFVRVSLATADAELAEGLRRLADFLHHPRP
jgi:aspartate/methionine/tyrosine aminotransferase